MRRAILWLRRVFMAVIGCYSPCLVLYQRQNPRGWLERREEALAAAYRASIIDEIRERSRKGA